MKTLLNLKTLIVSISLAFILLLAFGCDKSNKDDAQEPETPGDITALVNLDPDFPVLLDVSAVNGNSVMVMAEKDQNGFPQALNRLISKINNEENPTEIFFNENEEISEIIASNGVRFIFNWLNKEEVALTLIDPNTNEQLNTVVDLSQTAQQTPVIESRSYEYVPRKGEAYMEITERAQTPSSPVSRSGNSKIGNVYLKQCGAPATAECWVNVYDYNSSPSTFGKGRFRGPIRCTKVDEGHYQYTLPQSTFTHHDIADYCDAINDVINSVCGLNAWTAPGSGSKQYFCLSVSAALASGIVSGPVAATFLTACEAISVSIDAMCRLLNGYMDLPVGAPTASDALCQILREMNLDWDTPLLIEPIVNALPSCIHGGAEICEADAPLKDVYVTWGGEPTIESFKLEPPAPGEWQSYSAIAELSCLPPDTRVTMDIIGTDEYTKTITDVITSTNLKHTAILNVPGARTGVRDVCTVTVVTPKGETISKKASLVFN